jgi:peptide/nickel transport system ATP-binding protein
MPAAASPLLSVHDLSIAFGRDPTRPSAVQALSFELAAGETLAIVGESGSGKSVSVMSLLQLLPKTTTTIRSGQALFDGEDLLRVSERRITQIRGAEISMVFQEPMTSLNPVLTIGRQITEVFVAHQKTTPDEARRKALDMLEKVRISDPARRMRQYPHQLSGGMRQRVMIAMALACRPRILIADEPTTALDVTVQAQVLDLIRDLKSDFGTGVILITHDMGVVAEMADRVVVMRAGEKVEEGLIADVFERPKVAYTRALLDAVPRLGDAGVIQVFRPPSGGERVEPTVDVRNLSVRFDVHDGVLRRLTGRIHAVEDVSFSIAPGETLGLVGESGSGKSTTGRALLRLEEPSAGTIAIDGYDVATLDRRAMKPIRRLAQMIFQDPFASLNPRIEAGVQVAAPLAVHGIGTALERKERAADLFRRVGLSPEMASRFPHEFSGGQRQRVCIARALALNPKLIIADEAVSALDVTVQGQVLALLRELQQEFTLSYLFISHDIAVIERIAHRVAVMYLGRIVEIGPCAKVLNDPRHPYTKRLLAAVPVADPRRAEMRLRVEASEVRSPIRPIGWTASPISYLEASNGHLVALDG